MIEILKCPVCGAKIVDEYDVCSACGWENDPVQRNNSDFSGGANVMSLNEAKKAFEAGQKVI